jgi:hypothetical protein
MSLQFRDFFPAVADSPAWVQQRGKTVTRSWRIFTDIPKYRPSIGGSRSEYLVSFRYFRAVRVPGETFEWNRGV